MLIESQIIIVLLFIGLVLVFLGMMGIWAMQRTMQQGFNELIKGLEEIAMRMNRRGD